jgi:glutathione synthase/RimK-type ligase-like ATP-grasp enzyme
MRPSVRAACAKAAPRRAAKDTTFAMMREAAARGHALLACEPRQLRWQSGGRVNAAAREIVLTGASEDAHDAHDAWFEVRAESVVALANMGCVLMRKDPPFASCRPPSSRAWRPRCAASTRSTATSS